MQVGDLVRVDDVGALVEPVLEAPGAYPFRMRLVDLHAWTD
ncbi:hypothetical protein ACFV24_32930 [Nocardia fluminea]